MKKILALLVIVVLLASNAFALTRGGIKTEARIIINDVDSDVWSETQLNNRIELAQIDILEKTWAITSRVTADTVEGTNEYILPNDLIALVRVSLEDPNTSGLYIKLKYTTLRTLDKKESSWEGSDNGTPAKYYERRNRVGIQPPPNSDYAGSDKLKIDYVEFPDVFADDDAVPFNSWRKLYPYHELLVWYVVKLCFVDIGRLTKASYFERLYNDGVERMRREINVKPDRSAGGEVER